ncbi:MAG: hypothetical protein A2017_06480 [Lentisphaerae bacterium GWF2_44_16]|nr:MAG: hypothetical protein A2017_06480 [Lentisphaerae bacterium GWF2_44_16]
MKIHTSLNIDDGKLKKYDFKRGCLSRSEFVILSCDYVIKHKIPLETLMYRPIKHKPYKSYKSQPQTVEGFASSKPPAKQVPKETSSPPQAKLSGTTKETSSPSELSNKSDQSNYPPGV